MAQLHAAMAVREAAREFHLQKKRAPMVCSEHCSRPKGVVPLPPRPFRQRSLTPPGFQVTKVRVDYYGRAHSHQSNATSDSAHRTREKRSPARVDGKTLPLPCVFHCLRG